MIVNVYIINVIVVVISSSSSSSSSSSNMYIYIYMHIHTLIIQYTRSPLEDSRLFGPSPWKVLATTYEKNDFWATQPLAKIF